MSSLYDGILEVPHGGWTQVLSQACLPRRLLAKNDESWLKKAMRHVQIPNTNQSMKNLF